MSEAVLKNEDINKVEVTLEEAVNKGDIIAFGDNAVVAGVAGVVGESIVCYRAGIFAVVAKADDTFNVGDKVYFDVTNRVATVTADNNKYLGIAESGKESGTDVVRVIVGA